MRKPARYVPIDFVERRRRRGGGVEYFHYPSKRALDLWEHVVCIGIAHVPKGHELTNPAQRSGYMLHYVRRGELVHVIRKKTYRVRAGELILMDYGRHYSLFQDRRGTAQLWWVQLMGKDLARIYSELGADTDPYFPRLGRERFERSFRELWMLVAKPSAGCEARMHAQIHAMLAELFAAREPQVEIPSLLARKSSLSEKVRMAVNLIEQHYHLNLGLKQMQSLVGMDMYNLAHRFRQEVGMAPIQYLTRYRVEIAKHLLVHTDRPLLEVARHVGYSDARYFTRVFRKTVGKSPKMYRRTESANAVQRRKR